MIGTILRVFAAMAVFGGVHSLLASRGAKERAAQWFGERQRGGLYRVFFITQSFGAVAALLAYVATLPDRVLYRVEGPLRWVMRLGQASGYAFAMAAAYQVGLLRISGLQSLLAWLRGEQTVPPEPEAQGPAPVGDLRPGRRAGPLRVEGPFRITRHPLNLSPLPIFWLTPTMTVKRLAFNLAGTLYLVLGSMHEEKRLREAYGMAYRRYQESEVPFYWPSRGAGE